MDYKIKIDSFEGPFDLLFHLIEKNKVDIYDIPIHEITKQFVEHVLTMDELDLDNTSEFLVLAATLLEIKSKMLLPVELDEGEQLEFEEADPRNELIRKLLEYKKYKMVSEGFKEREKEYDKVFYKLRDEIIPDDKDECLSNMTMQDIFSSFERIIKKKHKIKDFREDIRQLKKDTFTVAEKTEIILYLLKKSNTLKFNQFFLASNSIGEVIIIFLAILELIKLKKINVYQDSCFNDIVLELNEVSEKI
ncbi:segregation/condensation protein A [Alkaliphilus sp. AH-315-G20]|nr:segregation/condensation protein A [Alkaliphilus sp. AH-315-G20]